MILPSEESCAVDPVLNMLRNDDAVGYLNPHRGTNKSFLNRRRINTSLQLLRKHLSKDQSAPIADFACGTANFGIRLAEQGYNVDLVDNEPRHYDYIRLKTGDFKNINFHTGDINTFQSDKKYFGVFFGEALEHMEDPEKTLQILRDHLLPGGLLCLTTPNGDFVNGSEPKWHEVKGHTERNAKLANNIGNHVCEFGFQELKQLVREAGFGILDHVLVNSEQMSRSNVLRRILPDPLIWKLDDMWSASKNKDGKYWGRIQIIVAQRFH